MPVVWHKPARVYAERVKVDRIIGLRHRILREGLPIETARFPGDDEEETHHFIISERPLSDPICCATFMLNEYEGRPAWQLRGMATDTGYQGRGLGRQLLEYAEIILTARTEYDHVKCMWCNARAPAVNFYERNGWQCVSEPFDIPTAGLHRRMIKQL